MTDMGLCEWFRLGEPEDRLERFMEDVSRLKVERVRVGLSWTDALLPGGTAFYDRLLSRLSPVVEVLPVVSYTPPWLSVDPARGLCNLPPKRPADYTAFLEEVVLPRWGSHFKTIELWNEPNNLSEWDFSRDPGWSIFAHMVGLAAYTMRAWGKETVLGGHCADPSWLEQMFARGAAQYCTHIGFHAFPDAFDQQEPFMGWVPLILKLNAVKYRYKHKGELWLTETGYPTHRAPKPGDFFTAQQEQALAWGTVNKLLQGRALVLLTRAYWYSWEDLNPHVKTVEETTRGPARRFEAEYHFGLRTVDGTPKRLFKTWAWEAGERE